MTVTLLAILGLIWCLLLALVVRWLHGLNSRRYWRHAVLPVLSVVAMAPLLGEYLTYYDFRKYCDAHAGMVVNTPVVASELLVDLSSEFIPDVLVAKNVSSAHWEKQRNYSEPYYTKEEWALHMRERWDERLKKYEQRRGIAGGMPDQCKWKYVSNPGNFDMVPRPRNLRVLSEKGVCIRLADKASSPRYLLTADIDYMRLSGNAIYTYRETVNYTDSVIRLIDTHTGKIMSEYRNISTRTGPIFHTVRQRHNRYSCEEASSFDDLIRWDKRLQVTEFLDRALLPSGE
jgi:hypothetical protein